jgi:hypothetical protein
MNYDLLKILSDSNKDIDNQKLMDYIAGKLSAEEKHEVETWMAESRFMDDAVEGLESVKNKAALASMVDQLNQDLLKRINKKKSRQEKRKLKEHLWIYYAIVIILFLIVITWYVLSRFKS